MISKEQIEQLSQLIQNVNPDKHYWFFRTMGGHFYDEFVSMGFIAIGYDDILMKDLKDLPEQDYMARAFIKIRLHELKNQCPVTRRYFTDDSRRRRLDPGYRTINTYGYQRW